MKTSIKIKKFEWADIAADGGVGTNWTEVQIGLREASVQFNGSDADTANYKNVLGSVLQSARTKGDKTINFQLADLTPSVIAEFCGGTVTSDANSDKYEAPENENQAVEKSIRFITDTNIMYTLPRVSLDAYPIINDDDLHYYQVNSVILKPEKVGEPVYWFDTLKLPDANDIVAFVLTEQTGAATINSSAHTVAIEVANGTTVTALQPIITPSLGASVLPISGAATDFTAPVVYAVTSANGDSQNWTVTVTVAA